MKESRWNKKYMIVFSDGERIVATGAMCDLMCIGFNEAAASLHRAAISMNDRQCEEMAEVFRKKSNEIYRQLNSFGFYYGIMGDLIKNDSNNSKAAQKQNKRAQRPLRNEKG